MVIEIERERERKKKKVEEREGGMEGGRREEQRVYIYIYIYKHIYIYIKERERGREIERNRERGFINRRREELYGCGFILWNWMREIGRVVDSDEASEAEGGGASNRFKVIKRHNKR